MSFSISDKTAIVTGAAHGVGLAIARLFAARGANVMFADMDDEGLAKELEGEVEETSKLRFFAGDLREHLTQANLLSATIDAFDRVDILVNASRQVLRSEPLDPENDKVELLLQQNLTTSLRLSQLVARRMIKQAEDDDGDGSVGSIVNLSSIASRVAQPELLGFSVASAALEQMTRSLAVALAPKRVRVNAVAFGSVLSSSLKDAIRENPEYRDDLVSNTPLGRIARASEVAEAVQFLASDASAFVTGEIITVDGGRTLIDPVVIPAH